MYVTGESALFVFELLGIAVLIFELETFFLFFFENYVSFSVMGDSHNWRLLPAPRPTLYERGGKRLVSLSLKLLIIFSLFCINIIDPNVYFRYG